MTRCSFLCLETAAKFVSLFSKDIGSVFCPHTFCSKIWTEYSSFVILFLILLFLFPPKIPFKTFYRHVTGGIRYDDKKNLILKFKVKDNFTVILFFNRSSRFKACLWQSGYNISFYRTLFLTHKRWILKRRNSFSSYNFFLREKECDQKNIG